MPKIDYMDLVDDKVRDDAGRITTDDRDTAIQSAVLRYSHDKPQTVVEDVTAPGGKSLPLPSNWVVNFSRINSLEYPIGNTPPSYIGNYSMYQSPTELSVALDQSINASEFVRCNFTSPHVLTDAADTIPELDRDAVACFAAAILCDDLAAYYSGSSDSSINADNVNHGDKANRFRTQAKTLRKRYFTQLGIEEKRNVAAGVNVDLDRNDSHGNDRLFHKRRYR